MAIDDEFHDANELNGTNDAASFLSDSSTVDGDLIAMRLDSDTEGNFLMDRSALANGGSASEHSTETEYTQLNDTEDEQPADAPSLDDVQKACKEAFSSNAMSGRNDEQNAVYNLLIGVPAAQRKDGMALLTAKKKELGSIPNVPRAFVQWLRPCKACGTMGHKSGDKECPKTAVAPAPPSDTASTTADSEQGKAAAPKKATSEAKKKKKELRERRAAEEAARKAAAAETSKPAAEAAADSGSGADEDSTHGEDEDDNIAALTNMFMKGSAKPSGKAIAAAAAAPRKPAAKPADDDAASTTSSVPSGDRKQQQQQQRQADRPRTPPASKPEVQDGRGGKQAPDSRAQQQSRSRDSQRDQAGCYICGEKGHIRKDCPQAKPPQQQQQQRPVPGRGAPSRELFGGRPAATGEPAAADSWAGRIGSGRGATAEQPASPHAEQSHPSAGFAAAVEGNGSASPIAPPLPPLPAPQAGAHGNGMLPGMQMHAAPSYASHHDAFLPPAHQQQPADEDDDGMAALLEGLGVGDFSAPAPAATSWGGPQTSWGMPPQLPEEQQGLSIQLSGPPPGVSEDEDAIQRALQASMQPQAPPRNVQRAAGGNALHDVAQPGLANATGEYNCFLNAIIQSLWQCTPLREGLLAFNEDNLPMKASAQIVRALVRVFRAFKQQEDTNAAIAAAIAAGQPPPQQRAVVSPNELREALATQHTYELGEMYDACEVLRTLYDSLADMGAGDLVNAVFGLKVGEAVQCKKCNLATHKHQYTQYFQQVSAAALRNHKEASKRRFRFGECIRHIEGEIKKTCDTDRGGCGTLTVVTRCLENPEPPAIFTIELGWGGATESSADIAATLAILELSVDPGDIYVDIPENTYDYRLRSMMAYYGEHYQAFVLMPDTDRWFMFDDSNVSSVGDWDAVQTKCQLGKIQPSVLFFELYKF